MLFSLTWQHDGDRWLQINESKVTCNHPRFSSLDVFAFTVTRKMRNSNLFEKVTGTSYETGYLTCKSFRWFITATVLVFPRFSRQHESTPASVCPSVCVRVCVEACRGTWMTACQWKRCHYLADDCASCDRGQGHITSGELTLCGQETLLSDFPLEGKHSCHNLLCHYSTSFRGYSNMRDKKKCVCVWVHDDSDNSMKDTYLKTFFYRSYFF